MARSTDLFYRSIDDYLVRIKLILETSKAIGNFMIKSTNAYEEKEDLWSGRWEDDQNIILE